MALGPSEEYWEYLDQARLTHLDEGAWPGQSLIFHIETINELIRVHKIKSVLDFGCGKARHHKKLSVVPAKYDPAIPEISELPVGPFELVISTDVLEHVPEGGLDFVLNQIYSRASRMVYLHICTRPAARLLPNRKNAHATVRPPEWWRGRLKKFSKPFSPEIETLLSTTEKNITAKKL